MAPGVEMGDLDWLTILLAIVANVVVGFLWYSPKMPTGKLWMSGNKFPAEMKPLKGEMMRGMLLMMVGAFLLMFVFQHTNLAYRDAYQLDGSRMDPDGLTFGDGAMGAFFTWLGFFVPVLWGGVAWERKPWSLFFVNAGYYLVTLMIAGLLFAWRL